MSFVKSINWDDPDIGEEEIEAAQNSLKKGIGAKGENIELLEKEFCDKIGCNHAILTSNGTTALIAATAALTDLWKLKNISVPSFSFIASANAPKNILEYIRLIDCNEETWNIDNINVSSKFDSLMSVDVGGVPCDYDELKEKKIPILADSAESLGSTYKGKQIGAQADIHCFSFQRSKVITCGEGGLITTNNSYLARFCRSFINHGYSTHRKSYEYIHNQFGLNFRICDVEAAILRVQLRKLDKYVKRRREVGGMYTEAFKGKFGIQKIPDYCTTNYFLFGILVDENRRDLLAEYLIRNGINVKCWKAIHQQDFWKNEVKNYRKVFINSTYISNSNILLPIHNKITDEEVNYIIEKVLNFA